jgi:4-oxalmesaconate hydratase
MIHVSTSCNACFHTTGARYLNADTTAFMQCLTSDLFHDFPTLRFVIPHGGGAVSYHWGRFRGLAQEMKKPPLEDQLPNNVFLDTCVYHQAGIDLSDRSDSRRQHPVRERDDRRSARHRPLHVTLFDDTKRYIESADMPVEQRFKICEGTARGVHPRLHAALTAQGR